MNVSISQVINLCVSIILQRYAAPEDLVSVIGLHGNLQIQNTRTNLLHGFQQSPISVKSEFYLIEERDGKVLEDQMKSLGNVTNESFNPRGKFIFVSKNFSEAFTYLTASYYISDAVFLSTDTLDVFTYFPYTKGNLDQLNSRLVRLGNCGNVEKLDLFPSKTPKDWSNSTLRLTYRYFDAYSMCPSCALKGIDIDLFEIILGYMNIERQYSRTPDTPDLDLCRNFEVFIGNYAPKYGSIPFGEFSMSYTDDAVVWIIPAPQPHKRWRYFLEIFDEKVLVACFSTICMISITWTVAVSFLQQFSFGGFITVPVSSLSIFLGQGFTFRTTLASHWVLIVLITYLSLMMNFFFSTRLTYLLNGLDMEANIEDLSDAIEAKLVVGCPSVLLYAFNNSKKRADYLENNFFSCDQSPYCVLKAARDRDMVVCKTLRRTRYLKDLVDQETGKWMVKELKSPIFVKQVAAFFKRGLPLFDILNRHIFSLVESGIINVVIQKYEKKTVVGDLSTPVKELGLDHLVAPIFLWVFGLGSAFVVFLTEKICFSYFFSGNSV